MQNTLSHCKIMRSHLTFIILAQNKICVPNCPFYLWQRLWARVHQIYYCKISSGMSNLNTHLMSKPMSLPTCPLGYTMWEHEITLSQNPNHCWNSFQNRIIGSDMEVAYHCWFDDPVVIVRYHYWVWRLGSDIH
jgi:hypothetical protein